MDLPKLILTLFGAIFIILGLLQQGKGYAEWNIRFFNSLKGVKSEITKQSIAAQKVQGIIFIILGVAMLIVAFIVIPSISSSFPTS